jgi:hypothetical protein
VLEEKNKVALADFLDIPDNDPQTSLERLRAFSNTYGPLLAKGEDKFQGLATVIVGIAREFAAAWDAKTVREAEAINKLIDRILGTDIYKDILVKVGMPDAATRVRPVILTNFRAGTWEPEARTLLDTLAITLVRSRKALHRCERPECRRYFVKTFSRARYCCVECSEDMRRRGQSESARRRRKPKGKRK